MKKILFVDTVHPILEKRLLELGYVCEHDLKSTKEEIESKIDQYFGLVIRSRFPIDEVFLNKSNSLKFIARSGAGLENINVAYSEEKGITVFNSPEGNMDAVGEQAIGMLLMLFNKLKKGDLEVRATGTNSLMQKEVRSQRLTMFLQTAQNPAVAPFIKMSKLISELA